jgi:hypothetical protein
MITQTVQKHDAPAVAGPAPVLAGPGITHTKFTPAYAGTLEQKAERDWRDICQRASDGGHTSGDCVPADADRLMQVCAFLARSMSDFNADVSILNQIRNQQTQLVSEERFAELAAAKLEALGYFANIEIQMARLAEQLQTTKHRAGVATERESMANLANGEAMIAIMRLKQSAPRLFPTEAAR